MLTDSAAREKNRAAIIIIISIKMTWLLHDPTFQKISIQMTALTLAKKRRSLKLIFR